MKQIPVDEAKLLGLYVNRRMTITDCAKALGVSYSVIYRYLKKIGIKIRPSIKNSLPDITDEQVVDLYWNQNLSIAETAKRLGTSDNFVKMRLKKSGRGTRSVKSGIRLHHKSDNIPDSQLIHLYDAAKWSCGKISFYYGKSYSFVRSRFIGINKARRKNILWYNGAWKGGINSAKNAVRASTANMKWRQDGLKRCGFKSEISGKTGALNCHHIYPFRVILKSAMTKNLPLPHRYRNLIIAADKRFYTADNCLVVTEDEHSNIEQGGFHLGHPWWKI